MSVNKYGLAGCLQFFHKCNFTGKRSYRFFLSMLTIRLGNTADAAMIAEFSRQAFYETFASSNSRENMERFMQEQFSTELLMAETKSPGNIFLLAFDDRNELAGYTRLREHNSPPSLGDPHAMEIARIYAATKLIGKGVGRMLMQKSIELAKQKKIKTLWLGVWEKNQRAIHFYTQWGFVKFDTHIFMLGHDPQTDWLMKKTLEYS